MAAVKKHWVDVNARRKPDRAPVWCRPVGCWIAIITDSDLDRLRMHVVTYCEEVMHVQKARLKDLPEDILPIPNLMIFVCSAWSNLATLPGKSGAHRFLRVLPRRLVVTLEICTALTAIASHLSGTGQRHKFHKNQLPY